MKNVIDFSGKSVLLRVRQALLPAVTHVASGGFRATFLSAVTKSDGEVERFK